MANFKTLTTTAIIATFALGSTAMAQDAEWTEKAEATPFETADIDSDGGLSMDEYKAFVDSNAAAGDTAYATIQSELGYEAAFTAKDSNADGLVSSDELALHTLPNEEVLSDVMESPAVEGDIVDAPETMESTDDVTETPEDVED